MENINVKIGKTIAERRKELNMNQSELASALGLSRRMIYNIEHGETELKVSQLYRIAEVLDVNVQFILGLREPPMAGGQVRTGCYKSAGDEIAELNTFKACLKRAFQQAKERTEKLTPLYYQELEKQVRKRTRPARKDKSDADKD